MKSIFTVLLSVFCMNALGSVAHATLVFSIDPFSNEAELDALLASDDTTVIAKSIVRAGSVSGAEMASGNFETFTDFENDFTWEFNGSQSITLSHNELTGSYDLSMSNSGDSGFVTTSLTEWHNQLAISFGSGGVEIDFTGNIGGQQFDIYNPVTAGQWDGVLITFPEFDSENQESWSITATLDLDTPLPDLIGDQFRGEAILIQNVAIPEPSSLILAGLGLVVVIGISRLRK